MVQVATLSFSISTGCRLVSPALDLGYPFLMVGDHELTQRLNVLLHVAHNASPDRSSNRPSSYTLSSMRLRKNP